MQNENFPPDSILRKHSVTFKKKTWMRLQWKKNLFQYFIYTSPTDITKVVPKY